MPRIRVLLVDDNDDDLLLAMRALEPLRLIFDVVGALSAESALEALAQKRFDVVVSDLRMSPVSGIDLLADWPLSHPRRAGPC